MADTATTGKGVRTAWTVKDLAGDWGVGRRFIYSLIASGDLRAVETGKSYLIPDTAVRAFLGETAA